MKKTIVLYFAFFFYLDSFSQNCPSEITILSFFEKNIFGTDLLKFPDKKLNKKVEIITSNTKLKEEVLKNFVPECELFFSDSLNQTIILRKNKKHYSRRSKNTISIYRNISCNDLCFTKINLFYPVENEGIYFIIRFNNQTKKLEYSKFNYSY
jgi:hypothetical protein